MEGRKVLMTYGGWAGHDPKVITDTIADWLREEGAQVIISDDLEVYTDDSLMSSIDLVIQNITMGSMSRLQSEGLLKALKSGTGLVGCHGGIGDSFRVNITNDNDPICAGIKDFEIHTEQYYMHIDPNINVLATTTYSGEHGDWFAGAVMPVVWKKYYGEGRVFYTSLGHARHDFDVPEAWEILTRGIRWRVGVRLRRRKIGWRRFILKGKNRLFYDYSHKTYFWDDLNEIIVNILTTHEEEAVNGEVKKSRFFINLSVSSLVGKTGNDITKRDYWILSAFKITKAGSGLGCSIGSSKSSKLMT